MTIPAILLSSFNNEPFHLSLKTKGPTIEEGWTRLAFVFLGTRIIYSGRATHTPGDKDSLGLLTKLDHMIQQLLKLRCRGLLRWQACKSVTVQSEYLAYRPYVKEWATSSQVTIDVQAPTPFLCFLSLII